MQYIGLTSMAFPSLLRQEWQKVKSCSVMMLCLFVSAARAQSSSSPTALRDRNKLVHAIVNSASVGQPPKFDGDEGESPIRSEVDLIEPTTSIVVLVQGMLWSREGKDRRYADPVNTWSGYKLEQKSPPRPHDGLKLLVWCEAIDGSVPAENADPDAEFVLSASDRYSFKQNRVMREITRERKIVRVGFKVDGIPAEFEGFFRVQLYNRPTDTSSPLTIRFGHLDRGDEDFRLGSAILTGSDFRFPGDFLLPVGIMRKSAGDWRSCRTLTVPGHKSVRIRVSGIFIFSGAFPREPDHIGGGGGFQDVFWRYDHVRISGRPVYDVRRVEKWQHLRLLVLGFDGKEIVYEAESDDQTVNHEYVLRFQSPADGKLSFFIQDGDEPYDTLKTLDNIGAFLVEYVDAK